MQLSKYKTQFIELYLTFMGLIIIFIFFYFRVIAKRSAYSLDNLKDNITFYYLFLCVIIIVIHSITLFMILYVKIFNKTGEKNSISVYVNKFMEFFFYEPLNYIISKIAPHIPFSGTVFISYGNYFIKTDYRIILMEILCFMLYFLPKIIMSLLFFIEVIFFNRIEYFIKYFFILLIPILYKIFLVLSEKFYTNNIDDVFAGLIVNVAGDPNQHGVYTAHTFRIKEDSGYTTEDLTNLIDCWQILYYLVNLNSIIRVFIAINTPYVTLFTSSLYMISGSYHLYYFLYL